MPGDRRRPRGRALVLLGGALAACSLGLAACGSASGPSTTTTSASSSSGFIARATAVCRTFYDKAYALPAPAGLADFLGYPAKQQALSEAELSGLRSVTPPPSARAAYTAYLHDLASINALNRPLAAKAASEAAAVQSEGAGTASKTLQRLGQPHAVIVKEEALRVSAERQARALELRICAENPYTAEHTSEG